MGYVNENIQEEPIVISKSIQDKFLQDDNYAELIGLYAFYYRHAKRQKTDKPKTTTAYTAKGMKWTEEKVRRIKKILINLGVIEDVTRRKYNRISGHFIHVKFLWSKEKTDLFHPTDSPECRDVNTVEDLGANALSVYKENALSVYKENAFPFSKEKERAERNVSSRQSVSSNQEQTKPPAEEQETNSPAGQQDPPAPKESLAKKARLAKEDSRIKKSGNSTYNDALRLLDLWVRLGLRDTTTAKSEDFAIKKLQKAMEGKLFSNKIGYEKYDSRKFTFSEILIAMRRFKIAANNQLVEPALQSTKEKMKKMSIDRWLLDEFTVRKGNGKSPSNFIKYFEGPAKPLPVEKPIEDPNPEYTKAIQNKYTKTVLSGIIPAMGWSIQDQNNFIRAAKNAIEYFSTNKCRLNGHKEINPDNVARWLVNSIVETENYNSKTVHTGWLISKPTWNGNLTQFLVRENVFSREDKTNEMTESLLRWAKRQSIMELLNSPKTANSTIITKYVQDQSQWTPQHLAEFNAANMANLNC